MSTTTLHDVNATIAFVEQPTAEQCNELTERYTSVIQEQRLSWTTHQRLIRLLGAVVKDWFF